MPQFYPMIYSALAILGLVIVQGSIGGFGLTTVATGDSSFAILTTSCHTTDHTHPLTAIPASVPGGSSGTILFSCSGGPAFTVTKPGIATPEFTLPQGYSALGIVVHISGAASCSPSTQLSTGQPFNFNNRESFDYCASYANPPHGGLSSFDLTWTRTASS